MIEEALAFTGAVAAVVACGSMSAGLRRPRIGLTASNLLKAKFAAGMAGAVAGMVASVVLPGRLGLLAAIGAPLAGFFAADIWLARREHSRRTQVRRDLPALLDLLRVSVDAGLSLPSALAEVGRRSRAPLAAAWAGVAAEVSVGVGLRDALDRHRRALPLPEIEALVAALGRSARHGAPLSDTLAAQARAARLARRRAVQEQAAKAGPKMQLVVALLLVPSVMLLVAAGLLSALLEGGTSGMFGV